MIILPNNVRGRSENKPTHTAPGNTLWLSERDGAGDPNPTLWAQMDASGTNWVDVATLGGGGIQQSSHRFPLLVRVGGTALLYKLQIRTLLIHEEE